MTFLLVLIKITQFKQPTLQRVRKSNSASRCIIFTVSRSIPLEKEGGTKAIRQLVTATSEFLMCHLEMQAKSMY